MVYTNALTLLIANGTWGKVRAIIDEKGMCLTEDFLNDDLQKMKLGKHPETTAYDRCLMWFDELAKNGTLSRKRLRQEDGFQACCFEISRKQIRFPCFRDGNAWIITHGFFKPGAQKGLGKWPSEQISRTHRLIQVYRERKKLFKSE